MKQFIINIPLLLLLAWVITGCAGMKRIEANTDATTNKVNNLQAQMETMIKAIDDLNINQGGATNSMRADLTILIKQLETQLERMKAEMDETQYRFKQLEKKMDALANQRLQVTQVIRDSTDSTGVSTSKVIGGLDIEKLYNQAREDYISGKYDVAFNGFETVLQKDNTGTFKDNALYWMGECYYKQEKYSKASEYYSRCVSEYPQGNKMCSAYFKLGLAAEKGKKKNKRDEAWKILIDKCPSTNEAKRAEDMMK